MFPVIHPVGWSADGKFAYISVLPLEFRGGHIVSYVIVDAVEDTIVWMKSDDSYDWEMEYLDDSRPVEEISWERMREEASTRFREHRIVQDTDLELKRFPLKAYNKEYRAKVIIEEQEWNEEDVPFPDTVASYNVLVTRGRDQEKRINHI